MALNVRSAGKVNRGLAIGLSGEPGAGKTTLAATFPSPLFVDLEGGTFVLGEDSDVPVQDVRPAEGVLRQKAFMGTIHDIAKVKDLPYKTIVVDSWSRLSDWLVDDILKEDGRAQSLMQAMGGYGKGRDAHVTRTGQIVTALTWLQENRNVHVVYIMHSKMGMVDLPDAESYSRFGHEGVKESTKRVMMACDVVAVLRQEFFVEKAKGDDRTLVSGSGERELFTGSHPGWECKSRFHDGPVVLQVKRGENPFASFMK